MSNNTVETVSGSHPPNSPNSRRAKVRPDGGSRASGVAVAALIISIVALGAVFATLLVTLHRQQTEDHSLTQAAAAAPSPQQTMAVPATPPSQPAPTSQPAQAQRSEASQAVSDEAMQRELNMKLATDQELALHPLDATVKNGRVTLRGTLPSERLKERVESIAKSIRGVKEVANQISVQGG